LRNREQPAQVLAAEADDDEQRILPCGRALRVVKVAESLGLIQVGQLFESMCVLGVAALVGNPLAEDALRVFLLAEECLMRR
jgi:hypothetical protein